MNRSVLLQITPEFYPKRGGVGDYSRLLGQMLETHFGVSSIWLIGGSQKCTVDADAGAKRVHDVPRGEMLSVLRARAEGCSAVLVHYSGYGYARRGAPIWLLTTLKRLRAEKPSIRIIVMFHELFASGPAWTSAFWMSPAQRWVARGLARIADAIVTNREEYGAWLSVQISGSKPLHVIPVFSNLGESSPPLSLAARPAGLLVYAGGEGGEDRTELEQVAIRSAQQFGLSEIHVFGAKLDLKGHGPASLHQHGFLNEEALAGLFANSRFGLLDYNARYLGKSGIFAAMAAHGVCPILLEDGEGLPDGLRTGVHFFSSESLDAVGTGDELAERVASVCHQWYQRHSLIETAAVYARVIKTLNE